jgi:hypothetical protein
VDKRVFYWPPTAFKKTIHELFFTGWFSFFNGNRVGILTASSIQLHQNCKKEEGINWKWLPAFLILPGESLILFPVCV